MAKHECPDCGHVHEMKAEERIRRLEERVRQLEAQRCSHPHWTYTPSYYPWTVTNGTTWQPDLGTTITVNSPQLT